MTRLALVVLACAFFSTAASAEVRSYGPGILLATPVGAGLEAAKATGTVRSVRIDGAALHAATTAGRLELPSSGPQPLVARNLREHRREDGLLVWTGTIDTRLGAQSFLLTAGDGVAFGSIPQVEGHPLRIETRAGEIVLVEGPIEPEIAQTEPDFTLPPEPTAADRATRRRQEERKAEGAAVIDVLLLYTPRFVTVWGSNATALTRLAYIEELANLAYADSQMTTRIRVVGRHLVDHTANDDNADALVLMAFGTDSDPLHREALRMRAMYGADVVSLVREASRNTQTSCGNGYLRGYHGDSIDAEYGFSIVGDRGMGYAGCSDWVLAHEIGHNLGAHHDNATTRGDYGAFAYSRGWRQTLDATSGFATVMAYDVYPQVRIGRFSNPRQSDCLGQPCGDAETADNARGQDETGPIVAATIPAIVAGSEPALTVSDVVVAEGNTGVASARFVLSLSAAAVGPVDVVLATMPGSAVVGDFVALQKTIRIAAGQTSAVVNVQVRGDFAVEIDEVFALNVISATGARIADGQGVATITNDEATPTLSLADVALSEGDAGVATATFTASLSAPSAGPVTFAVANHQFKPAEATHPATLEDDFHQVRITGLSIPAGQTSVQFSMPVIGDTTDEEDETFYVLADMIVGARHGDINATATIIDDDSPGGPPPTLPTISIADAQVQEGNAGTVVATFAVTLSAPATSEVRFGAGTRDGTAVAGADYTALALSAASIPAGGTTANVAVSVRGDTLDESDETFTVELINLVGATPGDGDARGLIRDDDGSADTPVLAARDDRWVLLENSPNTRLEVLANDVISESRMRGGSLSIVEQPVRGQASISDNGTATAGDDVVIYRPDIGASGEDLLVYRACEAGGRCVEALASVVLRPHLDVDMAYEKISGFRDFEFHGLQALPEATFDVADMTASAVADLQLAVDPTPETPWDGGRAGTAFSLTTLQPEVWQGYYYPRDATLLVDATAGGDVDLYLGLDENRNGVPDPGEVRCTSAMSTTRERCETLLRVADEHTTVWVMAHNRTTAPLQAITDFFDVGWNWDYGSNLSLSGPATLPAGAHFPVRMEWGNWYGGVHEERATYITVADRSAAPVRRFPVRFHGQPEGREAAPGFPGYVGSPYATLAPGESHERIYVEVPAGVATMTLSLIAYDGDAAVHVARADADATPEIGDAPPRSAAVASIVLHDRIRESLAIDIARYGAGRWYITPVNPGVGDAGDVNVSMDVSFDPAPQSLRPGSYFNPERGGHGLLVYPAGGEWAGLWYTYLQDGTPTWYYLQGSAPTLDTFRGNVWEAHIYRGAWTGTENRQVTVGRAKVTPGGDGGLVFHYTLDGESGAEQLSPLGSGCPTFNGMPLDVSSHWFNPARSGTGYSVQMWPDYEFYAAFVYDAWGVPRFLTAERNGFGGADATLQLDQLHGFCPLCVRTGNPTRADVGNLRRRFANGTFAGIELDAIWTDGVPGAWTANESIQTLGGPGTTQGCQP